VNDLTHPFASRELKRKPAPSYLWLDLPVEADEVTDEPATMPVHLGHAPLSHHGRATGRSDRVP
jgi:hypothetical protein